MKKAIYLLLSIVLFGSCAVHKYDNKEQVLNKRKYRKGYHFQGFKTAFKKRPKAAPKPKIKHKEPNQFSSKLDKESQFHYSYRTFIDKLKIEERKEKEVGTQAAKKTPFIAVQASEESIGEEIILDENKLLIPVKKEKTVLETVNLPEPIIESGKYGGNSGLNKIGVSLLSFVGLKTESNFPWLAYVIPSFIFVSGSMLFYFGGRRRKKKKELLVDETGEYTSLTTKNELMLRSTIFGVVISIVLYLLK